MRNSHAVLSYTTARFQFLIGTVNAASCSGSFTISTRFQFLIGTVNAEYGFDFIGFEIEFQFLIGTVNAIICFTCSVIFLDFNSS